MDSTHPLLNHGHYSYESRAEKLQSTIIENSRYTSSHAELPWPWSDTQPLHRTGYSYCQFEYTLEKRLIWWWL